MIALKTSLILLIACTAGFAETVIYGVANSGNYLPIGSDSHAGDEYQQVYDSSYFSAPATISGIAFSSALAGTYSGNLTITLSSTPLTISSPGSFTTANENADAVTVFSGVISGTGLGNSTYDMPISLTSDFTYDPTAGDLLMTLVWNDTPSFSGNFGLNGDGSLSSPMGRNFVATAFGAGNLAHYGTVTQFTEASTPEPSTFLLLGSGLLLAGIRRFRRA